LKSFKTKNQAPATNNKKECPIEFILSASYYFGFFNSIQ